MQKALQYLKDLIDMGGEFPDAVFQAALKFKVSQDALKAEYDQLTSCVPQRTLRELNGNVERVELPEQVAAAFRDLPSSVHRSEIVRIERVIKTFSPTVWPGVVGRYERLVAAHKQVAINKERMEMAM